jgi:hypothetical protein
VPTGASWSGVGFARRGAGEVAVLEATAVAFEREDLGVVDEAVDMAAAVTSSPKISPHLLNGCCW